MATTFTQYEYNHFRVWVITQKEIVQKRNMPSERGYLLGIKSFEEFQWAEKARDANFDILLMIQCLQRSINNVKRYLLADDLEAHILCENAKTFYKDVIEYLKNRLDIDAIL